MDPMNMCRLFQTSPAMAYPALMGNVYGNMFQQQLLQFLTSNMNQDNPQNNLLSMLMAMNGNNAETPLKRAKTEEDDSSSSAMDFLALIKSEVLKKSNIKEERESSIEVEDQETKPIKAEIKAEESSDWKPLRSRSFLTDSQVSILSAHFKRNPFPSKYELSALAEQIGVNKRVVQVIYILFSHFIMYYIFVVP